MINNSINIEKLYIESSNINLKSIKNIKELIIIDCDTLDINDIKYNNLEKLTVLNTNIINSTSLRNLNCKIEIIG